MTLFDWHKKCTEVLQELVSWRNNRANKGYNCDTLDMAIALIHEVREGIAAEIEEPKDRS